MSGRRASNPQPIAWKAIALPIELLPLKILYENVIFFYETTSIILKSNGGGRRIRTFEAEATDLQSVPFDRSGTPPYLQNNLHLEPLIGIEPMTY